MKKDLNFDLNIMPVIDILSVLITFLLLTAVWVELGSLDVRQAVGDNSSSGKNPPSVWASISSDNSVQFSLRDLKTKMQSEYRINARNNQIDWQTIAQTIQGLTSRIPELKTGIIRPTETTDYGDVIRLMDNFKKNNVIDLGISPLG